MTWLQPRPRPRLMQKPKGEQKKLVQLSSRKKQQRQQKLGSRQRLVWSLRSVQLLQKRGGWHSSVPRLSSRQTQLRPRLSLPGRQRPLFWPLNLQSR